MSNSSEFTKIFQEKRREFEESCELYKENKKEKDAIACICKKLEEQVNFKNIEQENLPAFAAWIAEEMKITPTQLRRFYTYVKGIERKAKIENGGLDSQTKAKLMFLLPKLAGSVQKKKQEGIKVLHQVFSACIHRGKNIQDKSDLEHFIEFFEAILDYHSTIEQKKDE